MDFGLKGKTALVLGGGGGLGRAISIALAGEGAKIAVADIDARAVAETEAALARTCSKTGIRTIGLVWDLADLSSIDAHVRSIETELGPVDVLVNITGGPPPPRPAGKTRRSGQSTFSRWWFLSSPSPTACCPRCDSESGDASLPVRRQVSYRQFRISPSPTRFGFRSSAGQKLSLARWARTASLPTSSCPDASRPIASSFSTKQRQKEKAATLKM